MKMGQYYITVLQDSEGKWRSLHPHHYNNGLKLMEHSWVGNNYCNTVVKELEKVGPAFIAHIGDYAMDFAESIPGNGSKSRLKNTYAKAWGKNRDYYFENPAAEDCHRDPVYICCPRTKTYLKYEFSRGDDWVVNDFMLLIAVGNGLGGGDYRGINEDRVGAWAFEKLHVQSEPPEGYTRIPTGMFRED